MSTGELTSPVGIICVLQQHETVTEVSLFQGSFPAMLLLSHPSVACAPISDTVAGPSSLACSLPLGSVLARHPAHLHTFPDNLLPAQGFPVYIILEISKPASLPGTDLELSIWCLIITTSVFHVPFNLNTS